MPRGIDPAPDGKPYDGQPTEQDRNPLVFAANMTWMAHALLATDKNPNDRFTVVPSPS